jgi:hypothetical protein
MKRFLFPACFAICILICSCHKDSKVIRGDYYFEASKNSEGWGATLSAYAIPGDSLRLAAFRQTGEEQINVNIKFKGTGDYVPRINQAVFFTTVGTDVISSHYRLDTTKTNTLTIASYSTETRIIAGSFTLHFLKDSTDPTEYVPVDFTSGLFRVKLPE